MIPPGDGTDRVFVVERAGVISYFQNKQKTVYLDISSKVRTESERGMLGLAFHPNFERNKKFYVYYTNTAANQQVSEFKEGANRLGDVTTERAILVMTDPEANHNGGELIFDANGYLYITTGDGGGANDQHGTIGNAQNLASLLGKILRIDVNSASNGKQYSIPSTNPFVSTAGAAPEIYAYGLRNPWRATLDKKSHRFIVADVGQDAFEEVNVIKKGKNYGWRGFEGFNCRESSLCPQEKNLMSPQLVYAHPVGEAIIGGRVSYSCKLPGYKRRYIFGDLLGKMFSAAVNQTSPWSYNQLTFGTSAQCSALGAQNTVPSGTIYAFGNDKYGDVYVLTPNGIHRILQATGGGTGCTSTKAL